MNVQLLRSVLAVPSVSTREGHMIDFLRETLSDMGIAHYIDDYGNVYATKGDGPGVYPAVCAHTDTVHDIEGRLHIAEEFTSLGAILRAYTPEGHKTGCGGDDKAGVFVCLELLRIMPRLKAAFFVSEEIGCVGSSHASPEFFANVGYCIEFDSPNGDIISFSSDGMQLFDEHGKFAEVAVPIMDTHGMTRWQIHPYTDVAMLRRKFNFECLNLPCGYHMMHSREEFVVLAEVENAIRVGERIIGQAKDRHYVLESGWRGRQPDRRVTYLQL